MDNLNEETMTVESNLTKIENKILSFIRSFKAPGPTYAPILIGRISLDEYENLFTENDGRCGAKLYYENGSLYLVDTLSYLHAAILGLVMNSLAIANPYLPDYFRCGSYSK